MSKVTIAVLGSGNVGSTLGAKWASVGHKVIFTSRDPSSDKIKNLVASVTGSRAATIEDGLKSADVRLNLPDLVVSPIIASLGCLGGAPVYRDRRGAPAAR